MAFFEFPHSRTYDTDLGWIIDRILKQQDQMDGQQTYMDELRAWMDENEPRIDHIEEIYDLFESGVLPAEVVTALENWLNQYGVLNAAKTYTDSQTAIVQGNLNTEISARTAADTFIQSEIDQIIAPSGEAPSAAEVQNARIGADGVTYQTLGEAIRTNDTELKNQLSDVANKLCFIYPIWEQGGLNDQGEYVSSKVIRTGFIDIGEITNILFYLPSELRFAIRFYDSRQAYISGASLSTLTGEYTWHRTGPRGAYIRLTVYYPDQTEPITPNYGKKLQIRFGKVENAFIEYALNNWGSRLETPLYNVSGVTVFPNNLIVAADCLDGYYIGYDTGKVVEDSGYFCTGYVPVIAGVTYRSNVGRNFAWYDSSKTYISGERGTGIQSGVTAPADAAFIRFTINKAADAVTSAYEVYFTNADSYDSSVLINGITLTWWGYQKTLNWIGDSIVDGPDFDEEVCNALGLIKLTTDGVNGGINGSTIALNGDGTDGRNALCLRYVDMPDNADIIAVSCGTNDFEYAWSPIGTIESTENTTFYGALKTLCEGLINKYPQKVIFFTTPIKRAQPFADGAGGEYTADGVMTTPFSKNKYGLTLGDYADIIKEVCGYYSIPVLDMYRESLLNPHLTSQQSMFDSVYTHPNTTGQKIMARRVCGWLTQLGYSIDGLF